MNPISNENARTSNIKMESIGLPKSNENIEDSSKEPISAGNVRNIQGLLSENPMSSGSTFHVSLDL